MTEIGPHGPLPGPYSASERPAGPQPLPHPLNKPYELFHIVISDGDRTIRLPGTPGTRAECEAVAAGGPHVRIVDGPIPNAPDPPDAFPVSAPGHVGRPHPVYRWECSCGRTGQKLPAFKTHLRAASNV